MYVYFFTIFSCTIIIKLVVFALEVSRAIHEKRMKEWFLKGSEQLWWSEMAENGKVQIWKFNWISMHAIGLGELINSNNKTQNKIKVKWDKTQWANPLHHNCLLLFLYHIQFKRFFVFTHKFVTSSFSQYISSRLSQHSSSCKQLTKTSSSFIALLLYLLFSVTRCMCKLT